MNTIYIIERIMGTYLGHLEDVRERHFWTKNPETFLVLMTSYPTENFLFHDNLELRQ